MNTLSSHFADRLGFDSVELQVGRPGKHGVAIEYLRAESSEFLLVAEGGELRYEWQELFERSLGELDINVLKLSVREPSQPSEDSGPISIATVFDRLPFRGVFIQTLEVDVQSVNFKGAGQVKWGPSNLAFTLKGLEPEVASRFVVTADLTSTGNFNAQFSTVGNSAASDQIDLQGTLGTSGLNIKFDARLNGYALKLAAALLGVPPGSGQVDANFEARMPWPVPDALSLKDVLIDMPVVSIDWRSDADDIELKAVTGSMHLENEQLDAKMKGLISGVINDSVITATASEAYPFKYTTGVLTAGRGLKLRIVKPGLVIMSTLSSISILSKNDTKIELKASVDSKSESLRMVGDVATTFTILGNSPVLSKGKMAYNGTVQSGSEKQRADINSTFTLDDSRLTLNGTVSANIFKATKFSAAYNLDAGSGSLAASNTLTFSKPLAATLVPGWAELYDLDSGKISAVVNLDWQSLDSIKTKLGLTLTDATGHYDDNVAKGISGELHFGSPNGLNSSLWVLAPSVLEIESINAGVALTQARISLSWQENRMSISSARVLFLGGTVLTSPFDYINGDANVDVELINIELARILALEGDDIDGSGLVSGHLPVVIRNHAPEIVNGKLDAHAPGGVIQLKPSFPGLDGQKGLEFALLALKDFRYTELSCVVDYKENGDLTLGVHLKGRNPAVEKGRPIQYNLNITENVPVLLESLRLDKRATSRIEKMLKQ